MHTLPIRPIFIRLLVGAAAVFYLAAAFLSVRDTFAYFKSPLMAVCLALAAVVTLVVVCRLSEWVRLTRAGFLLLVSLLAVLLRAIWVLSVETPPELDFLDMHNGAWSVLAGDYSFMQNEYFSRWVYQLGFILYEALLIKLFGGSLLVLKLFNIGFNVGTMIVVYGIGRELFDERSGRVAALLYALYLPHIIMCSVLTNQFVSTFLFALACWLVVRRRGDGESRLARYSWLLIGLALGFGNLMRPLGGFFMAGCLFYIVFLQGEWTRRRVWQAVKKGCGIVVVYVLLQQAASYAVIHAGITSHPLASREPYWKFMLGLNPDTTGGWSQADTDYVLRYPIGEERDRAELEVVKQRLSNHRQLVKLFGDKFVLFWGTKDAAVMWSFEWTGDWDRVQVLKQCERIMYVLMTLFGCLAAIALLRRKGIHPGAAWMALLLLGYVLLHLFIEIQTRYRFDIMPVFIVLSGYGVAVLYGLMARCLSKRS